MEFVSTRIHKVPDWALWAISIALATAIATAAIRLHWPTWAQLTAASALCLLTIGAVVEKVRTERRMAADKEERKRLKQEQRDAQWKRAVETCLRLWPAPSISDVNPYDLGIDRVGLPESKTDYLPTYVARDIDQKAQKQLQSSGLVLLLGVPGSGTTRTAYELSRSLHTKPVVLVPEPPDGLKRAVDDLEILSRLTSPTRLLVWLDRLDQFSDGGLTVALLRRLSGTAGMRIVATIPSTRYEAWIADNTPLAAEFGPPISIDRLPSLAEQTRAEEAHPGIDFSEGIAIAFQGLTALLVRLRAGQTSCSFEQYGNDCTLSRAIVDVATAWASTGTPRSITRQQLEKLLRRKFSSTLLTPSHMTEAFGWAMAPVVGGKALLTASASDGQSFDTSQQIAKLRLSEGESPPKEIWDAALGEAHTNGDSEAIGQIGFRAHISGDHKIAGNAWAKVTSLDEPSAVWLRRAADYSLARWNRQAEILPARRLLKLTQLAHGPRSVEAAVSLLRLGIAYDATGQLSKAAELYDQALEINETEFGSNDPTVAATLNELGNTWRNLGNPTKALKLLERARSINETAFGLDDPKAASTLNFLAGVWLDLGKPDTARVLAVRALEINENAFGRNAAVVAQNLDQLGTALLDLGKHSDAIEQLKRSLRIIEWNFPPGNTREAVTAQLLGIAWREEDNPKKGQVLIERALRINTEHFGLDHPFTAINLHNLGVALANQRKYPEALDLLKQALDGIGWAFGTNSPKYAAILDHLGFVWRALGDPAKGRKFNERALHLLRQFYGDDHPQVAIALRHLGQSNAASGMTPQARDCYQQALEIMRTWYPGGHPLTKLLAHDLELIAPDLLVNDDGTFYRREAR
ncbi:tetratricopeptide repeat protein [Rhodococcus sp. JVH1]|uniref:tetratricopeptide repeat protein n=1 Tax=Rhodococcus sp. JVH1 TaxID=745408 RepID=UPI000271F030|nr:tetratricopeptide repeat protein [Rhodococcus sp. JVH1]EJI93570.1 tetratricopeptide repeat family protein [Rhodococcus sp. JVH1]